MLSLPEKYKKDAPIAKAVFVRGATLQGAEKKRFETTVEDIKLKYQIEGYDIPNLVNDEYSCQVIMFLAIKLTELKHAAFISTIVQRCIKELCVIEFTDGNNEQFSFADKRLNRQNSKEIVIENEYLSTEMPLDFHNDLKTLFSLYIDYETILNRNNKHAYYVEMMTKSFLVCNQGLFSGQSELLDSKKLWYDNEKAMQCFPLLKKLKALKLSAVKANTIFEKSNYNKQIKETIIALEELIE